MAGPRAAHTRASAWVCSRGTQQNNLPALPHLGLAIKLLAIEVEGSIQQQRGEQEDDLGGVDAGRQLPQVRQLAARHRVSHLLGQGGWQLHEWREGPCRCESPAPRVLGLGECGRVATGRGVPGITGDYGMPDMYHAHPYDAL